MVVLPQTLKSGVEPSLESRDTVFHKFYLRTVCNVAT